MEREGTERTNETQSVSLTHFFSLLFFVSLEEEGREEEEKK